ncbi:BrnT family toxin [Pararhizobium sp. PWRC1-1]|uniref:BrnT family toxin n=1 Tax=Pararhizobium sp. PWRC1-1 TaxID=2804566 RepID=UPI003CF653A1
MTKSASTISKSMASTLKMPFLLCKNPRIEFNPSETEKSGRLAICPDTNRIITVVYTMRAEICRIISARPAHKNEQRIYHQSFPR